MIRIAAVASLAAMALPRLAAGQAVNVRAENRLAISRADETISLPWGDVKARIPAAAANNVRVRDVGSGMEVVSQAVGDDGNGTIDELIFQATFAPGEVKRFTVESGAPAKPARGRVYVSHQMPRDDVAWESDRIAYRIYGQGLWKVDSLLSSGVDVWVKRTRDTIIPRWYAKDGDKDHNSYHRDTGEGADFYDVGQTLGAGGTAIWNGGTMHRAWNFKSQRIIANGPVRLVFELTYQPWDAGNGLKVSEVKRISLDAGQNMNHVTSRFDVQAGSASDLAWVTGLNKRKGVVGSESKAQPWAWLSAWGPLPSKDGGHGDLGTAVMLPRDAVAEWREDENHYFLISHTRPGQPVSYWIGAGWTDSGDFRDVRDWWTYLDQFAQRLSSPIAVTWEGR